MSLLKRKQFVFENFVEDQSVTDAITDVVIPSRPTISRATPNTVDSFPSRERLLIKIKRARLETAIRFHQEDDDNKNEKQKSSKRSVSPLDVLSIDLIFGRIISIMFASDNGVSSFLNLALVCKQFVERALFGGRSLRIMQQVYPHMMNSLSVPRKSFDPQEGEEEIEVVLSPRTDRPLSDKEAFSFLWYANRAHSVGDDHQEKMAVSPLSCSSMQQSFFATEEPQRSRWYHFDVSKIQTHIWTNENGVEEIQTIPCERMFKCTLQDGLFILDISWYDDQREERHCKRVSLAVDPGCDYSVEVTGEPDSDPAHPERGFIHVLLHQHRYKLQQLTIEYGAIGKCGAGSLFDWSGEDADIDEKLCTFEGLCQCRAVHLAAPFHLEEEDGVSGFVYDLAPFVETYNRSRLATLPGIDGDKRRQQKNSAAAALHSVQCGGIAKYITVFSLSSSLMAFVNLRTHAIGLRSAAVVEEEYGTAVGKNRVTAFRERLALDVPRHIKGGPAWQHLLTICAYATKTTKTGKKEQTFYMPHFSYSEE